MNQINRRDLDDLARILARFEDKRTCPCPACRMARSDIPPFTDEDLIRARKRCHEIITLIDQYTQLGLPNLLIRKMLITHLDALIGFAYALGVDNERTNHDPK